MRLAATLIVAAFIASLFVYLDHLTKPVPPKPERVHIRYCPMWEGAGSWWPCKDVLEGYRDT